MPKQRGCARAGLQTPDLDSERVPRCGGGTIPTSGRPAIRPTRKGWPPWTRLRTLTEASVEPLMILVPSYCRQRTEALP